MRLNPAMPAASASGSIAERAYRSVNRAAGCPGSRRACRVGAIAAAIAAATLALGARAACAADDASVVEGTGAAAASSTMAASPATPPSGIAAAPSSTDPPQATDVQEIAPAITPNPVQTSIDEAPAATGGSTGNGDIERYRQGQSLPQIAAPRLHSLQEFMSEGTDDSPIGLELREDTRTLKTGERADGLLILKVRSGSPAAQAGLKSYSSRTKTLLEAATVAGAMVFPPAILAIVAIDQTNIGESYDMIIGVDGRRVTNFLDFEDQMRGLKPGDILYLSVVRNGRRLQIRVHVPEGMASLSY
jgi:PDZ domain